MVSCWRSRLSVLNGQRQWRTEEKQVGFRAVSLRRRRVPVCPRTILVSELPFPVGLRVFFLCVFDGLLLLYILADSARLFSVSDFAYSLRRYGALERPIAFSSLQPSYFLGRWISLSGLPFAAPVTAPGTTTASALTTLSAFVFHWTTRVWSRSVLRACHLDPFCACVAVCRALLVGFIPSSRARVTVWGAPSCKAVTNFECEPAFW